MQQALRAGRQPQCSFLHDGQRVLFNVTACPSYGELSIDGIELVGEFT
jgi:hypothetical protein